MANIITGLDIGTTSIKGVVADKKKDGTFSVVSAFSYPSAGLIKGILIDNEEALKVFRKVMLDLEKVSKKAKENIFVSINGKHILPKMSRAMVSVSRADQEIQQDDVDKVFQNSQMGQFNQGNYSVLHAIISEFFVDEVGEIKNPVGMKGNSLEIATMIIQAFKPHIDNLSDLIKKAGGGVSGIIFSPLAAERAVLSKRQKELGTVLIDFGGGTTSLAVYEEGKLIHSKSLPVGAGNVTNDIVMVLKVQFDIAEKIKRTYGYALSKDISRKEKIDLSDIDASVKENTEFSKKLISEVIEIRLEEILEFINNELKEAADSVQLPAGAVICGGGVKIAGIDELVKRELKLPVQIGYPQVDNFEIINPTHRDLIEDPEFSTAIGLLIWGSEELDQSLSSTESFKKFLKNLMP